MKASELLRLAAQHMNEDGIGTLLGCCECLSAVDDDRLSTYDAAMRTFILFAPIPDQRGYWWRSPWCQSQEEFEQRQTALLLASAIAKSEGN